MCADAYDYLCDPCYYKVTREGAEKICAECKKSADLYFAMDIPTEDEYNGKQSENR